MLYVSFYAIRDGEVDHLRSWMKEVSQRKDEALASYAQEGTRDELAYLVEGKSGPDLVYIAEVEDPERAREAFRSSKLPIDLEHRQVMRQVVSGRVEAELLYECAVDGT